MPYKINNRLLDEVTEAVYLGVTVTKKLSWKLHIANVCSKASKTVAFLRKNFSVATTSMKGKLYSILVRPIMDYASAIWDVHTGWCLIRVQRRAARSVVGKHSYKKSISSMLDELGWPALPTRWKASRLAHFLNDTKEESALKILAGILGPFRNSPKFIVPHSKFDAHRLSFYSQIVRDWNTVLTHEIANIDHLKPLVQLRALVLVTQEY